MSGRFIPIAQGEKSAPVGTFTILRYVLAFGMALLSLLWSGIALLADLWILFLMSPARDSIAAGTTRVVFNPDHHAIHFWGGPVIYLLSVVIFFPQRKRLWGFFAFAGVFGIVPLLLTMANLCLGSLYTG